MIEIELLQVALGNRDGISRNPSAKEWQEYYYFAKRQSVIGVVFAAIERLKDCDASIIASIPKVLLLQWVGELEIMRNGTGNAVEQVKRHCKEFEKAGFRTCLLKGVGNELFYSGMARDLGDIDLWVMPSGERNIDKAKSLTKAFVLSVFPGAKGEFVHMDGSWSEKHIVEIHFTPSMDAYPRVNKRLQYFFEEQAYACFNNETKLGFSVPTKIVNGVFLMHHAKRHFINEGIGIRHVIDYALLLRTLSEEEKKEVWHLMGQFELQRFASGMMYVITEVLGEKMSPEMKAAGWKTDRKRGEYLMTEMQRGGIFGKHYKNKDQLNNVVCRWTWFLRVEVNRMRYFPSEAFWGFMMRLRVGINNVKNRKHHKNED